MVEALVHIPGDELKSVKRKEAFELKELIDPKVARDQFLSFVDALASSGVKVKVLAKSLEKRPLFFKIRTHAFVDGKKGIITNTPLPYRKGEEVLVKDALKTMGVKIAYQLFYPAVLDGNAIVKLNEETLVVGYGRFANEEGIKRLKEAFEDYNVVAFKTDEQLNKILNIVDNLAVISEELAYTSLYKKLKQMEMDIVVATREQVEAMAVNFLPLPNNKVIMVRSTLARTIERHGFDVIQLEFSEMVKADAGPLSCALVVS